MSISSIDLMRIGIPINNEKFSSHIKKTILALWKCKKDIYPTTVPVLLNKSDFVKFEKYEYFITSNYENNCVQLYFFRDYFNKPTTVLCDKLFNCYKIDIECLPEVYLNTLFDCQIKKLDDTFIIYINDCICIHDNLIKNMSFEYRRMVIDNFINTNIISTPSNIMFKQKLYYKLRDVHEFIDDIVKYNIDVSEGLLFIPNNLPLIGGTQKSNMYWLKKNCHTIDLMVVEDGNDLILECYNFKRKMQYAKIINSVNDKLVCAIKELKNYTNGCIVEFYIIDKGLFPIAVKLDKAYPNGLRIIETVLFTIQENIQLDDIKSIKNVK